MRTPLKRNFSNPNDPGTSSELKYPSRCVSMAGRKVMLSNKAAIKVTFGIPCAPAESALPMFLLEFGKATPQLGRLVDRRRRQTVGRGLPKRFHPLREVSASAPITISSIVSRWMRRSLEHVLDSAWLRQP